MEQQAIQWQMKNGKFINISDMDNKHLSNTIAMLRGKGYVSQSELEMYLLSEPDGEQALELYCHYLSLIKTHPALDALEAELARRKIETKGE